jgi:iron complex outermembrane receptor protein
MKNQALWLGVSALALLWCSTAAGAQTAAAEADDSGTIETVVVTAQRRVENLMTTAVTASVLSGQDLQNRDVSNVNSLQFLAPNLTINDLGQGVDFDIRGIGKGEHNTQTQPGVVTYRDGASTFPGYMTAEPFYDIKSVEVFRGPQGTFVGQNATGGAVFVTTNDPIIGGSYDGYLQGQFGNYDDGQLQGAVNIPLTDTLALRVSGFGEARGSFYTITDSDPLDNCPNHKYANCKPGYNPGDLRVGAGRVSLLWKPTSALTVSVKYDALYQDYGAAPGVPFSQLQPLGARTAPYGIPNPYHDSDLFHITNNAPNARLDAMQRTILKVDYVFPGGIKLQSVSDYNIGSTSWVADLDGTDYGNPSDYPYFGSPATTASWLAGTKNWTFLDRVGETIYSEEINLISPDDQPITWVGGVYWQENDYTWKPPYQYWIAVGPRIGSNPTPSAANFYQYTSFTFQGHTNNQDIAAFGQVEAKLGGGVQASFGGRWTETRSQNVGDFWNYGSYKFNYQGQKSYNFSYKAALSWAINDGNYLYGFVATGYTGGGLNLSGPNSFGGVTDTNYEAGWKASDWFDGHLRTQLDAFYTDYDGFQISLADPSTPRNSYEINLPKTTSIYGFEGETQAVFGQLSFTATLGLMKSSIGNYWTVDPRFNLLATGTCSPAAGGTDPYCVNVKGHPITYAPTVTYNFGAQYVFDLDNGDTLTPRISFAHVGGQWASIFDNPSLGDRLGVRDQLGAQLAWATGSWVWTLFGTNLTDQQYVASNNSGGLYAGPPRQFGLRLLKKF